MKNKSKKEEPPCSHPLSLRAGDPEEDIEKDMAVMISLNSHTPFFPQSPSFNSLPQKHSLTLSPPFKTLPRSTRFSLDKHSYHNSTPQGIYLFIYLFIQFVYSNLAHLKIFRIQTARWTILGLKLHCLCSDSIKVSLSHFPPPQYQYFYAENGCLSNSIFLRFRDKFCLYYWK